MPADPATLLGVLAAYPLGVGALHGLRWLAPLVLPSIFARPAPPAQPQAADAALERRVADLERTIHRNQNDVLDMLSEMQADIRRAKRRREESP